MSINAMANEKDEVLREDDNPEDKGSEQQQPNRNDDQVVRPVDDVPAIQRTNGRADEKPEYEIIEVDDRGQPFGARGADATDGNRGGDEGGNLSEEESGDRATYLERQQDETTRDKAGNKRESHRDRRERRRSARERERNENAELRRQVQGLAEKLEQFAGGTEKRLNDVDSGRLRGDLNRVEQDIARQEELRRSAETKIKEAMSANDPDAFLEAQNARDNAVIAKTKLETQQETLKDRLNGRRSGDDDGGDRRDDRSGRRGDADNNQRQQPKQQQVAPLTGNAKRFADEFQRRHDWFDPKSRDPEVRRDSNRVRFLDAEVAAEGFDPHSQDYWDELEDRMRDVVPHVFDEDDPPQRQNGKDQRANGRSMNGNGNGTRNANGNDRAPNGQQAQQRRNGPPVADVGGRGGNGRNKTQVRITPERKKAMIDAGSLNPDGTIANPMKFERTLREFVNFDAREGVGR